MHSGNTHALFLQVLKDVRPHLKRAGFRSSGQNFILESAECWVILNFQKSRWSASDETTFYVNVSATPKRWHAFLGEPAEKVPSYAACEWRWRAEHFGPDTDINQWTIRDVVSQAEVSAYLINLFETHVIPRTLAYGTEAGLLASQYVPFSYPRLKVRSALLAADGNIEHLRVILASLLEQFGQVPLQTGLEQHIQALRRKYPEAMAALENQP